MKKQQTNLLALLLTLVALAACTDTKTIRLDGKWEFTTTDNSVTSCRGVIFDDVIELPGSMVTRGKGTPVSIHTPWTGSLYDSSFYFNPYMEKYRREGNMKFPFFLTPETHYVGTAWYRRTVKVPTEWAGKPLTLFLERPHIETTLFVNGDSVGHRMSLSVPHRYDVTPYLRAGAENEIVLRVYNGVENVCVGQDSHSVTDQTQGNWNGIVGRIELQSTPSIYRLNVRPRLAENAVDILLNDTIYRIDMGKDWEPWDEFNPRLYTRTVNYRGMEIPVTFGMREIEIKGRQFYLNGRPIWLRGTVECCCFPETGYAPMEEEEWMRIFEKCREYGINHMRFHSYCPPEAAFAAADRVGIYLQPEGPSWPNHGVRLRRGQRIDQYLMEETKRIVDTYGHHPSFVMMASGNEPAGDWVSYCNDWVREMKQYDPTRVYCGASVGGGWAWDNGSEFHVKGGARGLDWKSRAPQSTDDYYNQMEYPRNYRDTVPNTHPIIAHEQGQWCAFPDFKEIDQYTGAYKARNFEIFRDLLRDGGMEKMAEKFLMASGRLQTLCYKYEMERNFRTPDYAGFQLLALNDYSGQGSALEGVLNVHWREKGYCDAAKWRTFCNPVVPLARFPKFVYTTRDTLVVPIEVMNASEGGFTPKRISYEVSDTNGKVLKSGNFDTREIPLGKNIAIGSISWQLDELTEPTQLKLTVSIDKVAKNDWEFWVYPAEVEMPETNIHIANTLDDEAIEVLRRGGDVLLAAAGQVKLGSEISQQYLPVFWNTSWFKMRPPHTTGAVIDTTHPLFRHDFPTDDWANLNWWELLNRAQVMNFIELKDLDYQSPIQPIDTWHVSRKLGMLLEAKVLGGRLLMTTIDIDNNLDKRVVARQMRRAILLYMQSKEFNPQLILDTTTIRNFFKKEGEAVNMFTNDNPDELKPKLIQN